MLNIESIFFWVYSRFIIELLIFLVWGWGIFYALSKVTKYRNMLLGSLGCFGMMIFRLWENFIALPEQVFYVFPHFSKIWEIRLELAQYWSQLDLYYQKDGLLLIFQICIIAALAGLFKKEPEKSSSSSKEVMKSSKNEGKAEAPPKEQLKDDLESLVASGDHDLKEEASQKDNSLVGEESAVYDDESAVYDDESAVYDDESAVYDDESAVYDDESAVYDDESAVYDDESAVYDDDSAVYDDESAVYDDESAVYDDESAVYDDESAVYDDESAIDDDDSAVYDDESAVYDDDSAIDDNDSQLDTVISEEDLKIVPKDDSPKDNSPKEDSTNTSIQKATEERGETLDGDFLEDGYAETLQGIKENLLEKDLVQKENSVVVEDEVDTLFDMQANKKAAQVVEKKSSPSGPPPEDEKHGLLKKMITPTDGPRLTPMGEQHQFKKLKPFKKKEEN